MKLRSGKVKRIVAASEKKNRVTRKKIAHVKHHQKTDNQRRKLEKVVSQSEIEQIIKISNNLVVRIKRINLINRMSARENLNTEDTQPHGESNSENQNRTTQVNNSENLNRTTDTEQPQQQQQRQSDDARGLDFDAIEQALTTPLPDYTDDDSERDDDSEPQQQTHTPASSTSATHTAEIHTPPPSTNKKKMSEILARPAKLRTNGNVAENWKIFRRQFAFDDDFSID